MRLEIRAISRLKAGPERALVDEYLTRAGAVGRSLGFGEIAEREIDNRALSGKRAQTEALLAGLAPGALVVALDERGKALTSPQFADRLGRARDDGVREAAFLIGGADGMERSLLPAGTQLVSFGAMVWPHKLVRVMLAEQIYRAVSLLAGTPYHRD